MTALWIAIAALSALGLLFGLVLGYAARRFEVEEDPVAEQVDAILPQSQCGQCGYPGCRPYAEAVANGEMINKCAPGGEQVMLKLAELLNVEPQPLGSEAAAEPGVRWPISTRPTASAAPSAFRPVRWTPSSAPPAPCTPSSPTSAPAAICASPLALPTVLK